MQEPCKERKEKDKDASIEGNFSISKNKHQKIKARNNSWFET